MGQDPPPKIVTLRLDSLDSSDASASLSQRLIAIASEKVSSHLAIGLSLISLIQLDEGRAGRMGGYIWS